MFCYPLRNTRTDELILAFNAFCSIAGFPRILQFDQQKSILSHKFRQWLADKQISAKFVEAKTHKSNALAEIGINICKRHLKRRLMEQSIVDLNGFPDMSSKNCWCQEAHLATALHNATKRRFHRDAEGSPKHDWSPSNIYFRRDCRSLVGPIDMQCNNYNLNRFYDIDPTAIVETRLREHRNRMKNGRISKDRFVVGDLCSLLYNGSSHNSKHFGLSKIGKITCIDGNSVSVEFMNSPKTKGQVFTFHSDQLCKLTPEAIQNLDLSQPGRSQFGILLDRIAGE